MSAQHRPIPPNVQHINHARMRSRNGLELDNPSKLPFVRTIAGKILTPNHLHRAHAPGDTPDQPDITVAPSPNPRDQLMVGHTRRRMALDPRISRAQAHPILNPGRQSVRIQHARILSQPPRDSEPKGLSSPGT
jgi:hypothetical protein